MGRMTSDDTGGANRGVDNVRAQRVQSGRATTGRSVQHSAQSDRNRTDSAHNTSEAISNRAFGDASRRKLNKVADALSPKKKSKPKKSGGFNPNSKSDWLNANQNLADFSMDFWKGAPGFAKDTAVGAAKGAYHAPGDFADVLKWHGSNLDAGLDFNEGDNLVEREGRADFGLDQEGAFLRDLAGIAGVFGTGKIAGAGVNAGRAGFGRVANGYGNRMHVPDHGIQPQQMNEIARVFTGGSIPPYGRGPGYANHAMKNNHYLIP